MTAHINLADTLIQAVARSAVWRAMHFAPLWLALAIVAALAVMAWKWRAWR